MDGQTYLLKLEKNIMLGPARFIADFAESFLDYTVGNVTFDMMIRGGTRLRQGVLISRAYSYLIAPNHFVSCFLRLGGPEGGQFHQLIQSVAQFNKDEQMTWAWLVIAHHSPFARGIVRLVEAWDKKEIGVALVDYAAQQVIARSDTYLGRALVKHLKTFK